MTGQQIRYSVTLSLQSVMAINLCGCKCRSKQLTTVISQLYVKLTGQNTVCTGEETIEPLNSKPWDKKKSARLVGLQCTVSCRRSNTLYIEDEKQRGLLGDVERVKMEDLVRVKGSICRTAWVTELVSNRSFCFAALAAEERGARREVQDLAIPLTLSPATKSPTKICSTPNANGVTPSP